MWVCFSARSTWTYRVVVDPRTGRSRVVLAALLASLGWIGASRGFSLAVPVLWQATQLYETLGSMVLFLIWAYVMAWVILLGGFLLVRPPGRERVQPLDRPRSHPSRAVVF